MVSLENVKSHLQAITGMSRGALQLSTDTNSSQMMSPPSLASTKDLGSSARSSQLDSTSALSCETSTGPQHSSPAGEGTTKDGSLAPRPGSGLLALHRRAGALMRAVSAPAAVIQQQAAESFKHAEGTESEVGQDMPLLKEGVSPMLEGIRAGWQVLTENTRETLQVEVTSGEGVPTSLPTSLLKATSFREAGTITADSVENSACSRIPDTEDNARAISLDERGEGSENRSRRSNSGDRASGGLGMKIVPQKIKEEDMHKALSVLGAS